MGNRTPRPPSLLEQQLNILGFESSQDGRALAGEKARIELCNLRPLRLPIGSGDAIANTGRRRVWAELLARPQLTALAASIAVVVAAGLYFGARHPSESDLRVKGNGKTWVYTLRGGQVSLFNGAEPLVNGDRVRAEILAPSTQAAYLAVVDGDGAFLSSVDDIVHSRVVATAGEKRAFPGSLKLVGAPQGETLIVLRCEIDDNFLRVEEDLTAALAAMGGLFDASALPTPCIAEKLKLR